ncbi:MAG: hypothetical protein FD160_1740, partial [Caulobacteraceae bacterium]
MDRYEWLEKCDLDEIGLTERAIPENLRKGDFERARFNVAGIALSWADLGLLHWRRGLDPRLDFASAAAAFDKAASLAREHELRAGLDWRQTVAAAALYLINHPADIHFWDDRFDKARWPCYNVCLIYALYDKPLSDLHRSQLEAFLATHNDLVDATYRTYFDLLRAPADGDREALVRKAEDNWLKRKTNRFFEESDSRDGHGDYNEL